jgi:hypothetical protein
MSTHIQGTPKVHPLDREMLPEDPLHIQAFEVPGDTELMFRVVIEEFAKMGWDEVAILGHARNPFYAALHGLWRLYGEDDFHNRVRQVLSRVGVIRVRMIVAPTPGDLVQLETKSSQLGI